MEIPTDFTKYQLVIDQLLIKIHSFQLPRQKSNIIFLEKNPKVITVTRKN